DARGARSHRHQRVTGHARRRIHLQQKRLPVLTQDQIRTSPAVATERIDCSHDYSLQRLFAAWRQAAGTMVFRVVGEIFIVVVVISIDRQMSFVRSLSMHKAEAITPLPVYGISMISSAPCTVPSSP